MGGRPTFEEILARQRGVVAPARLRSRLHAELLAAPVAFAPVAARRAWWRPVMAAALSIAIAVGGAGTAAASSLPGEPAFALKQAVEELQLVLARDDARRASVALEIAERRLAELRLLVGDPRRGAAAAAAYAEAVARVGSQAERLRQAPASPERDGALERVNDAGARATEQLHELGDRLPAPSQQGIDRAIEQHARNQQRHDAAPAAPKNERAPARPSAPARGPASPRR